MRRVLKWVVILVLAVVGFMLVSLLVFGVGTDEPGGITDVVTSPQP